MKKDILNKMKQYLKEEDNRLKKERDFLKNINTNVKKSLKIKSTNLDKLFEKKGL